MPDLDRHATDGPIHEHFSLSYANYLVLPRALLQSMPDAWQQVFVDRLDEMAAAFHHVPQAEGYEVITGTEHILNEMDDDQLAAAGVEVDRYGGEDPPDGLDHWALASWQEEHETEPTYHQVRTGREMDGGERVIVPGEDPVPHYNRGRTYVAPRPATNPKPLDHFKVVHQAPTADSVQVVADEIRCLDCGSTTGMAGMFEPTLDQITAMAGRHMCSPRFNAAGELIAP